MLDALNNDRSNEELLSAASESHYDDVIETLQIQATGKTAMNRSSGSACGSAYVPT